MSEWNFLGKILLFIGALCFFAGIVVLLLSRFLKIGHLPGDIFWQKGNFSFYFPIVTCIVISLILTVIINIFFRR